MNRERAGTPGLPSSDRQVKYRHGWRAGRQVFQTEQAEQALAQQVERTG